MSKLEFIHNICKGPRVGMRILPIYRTLPDEIVTGIAKCRFYDVTSNTCSARMAVSKSQTVNICGGFVIARGRRIDPGASCTWCGYIADVEGKE